VSAHAPSTASAERVELTGLAHGAEREKRDARGNDSTTGDLGPRDRERARAVEKKGTDRSAPLGRERERVSARRREAWLGCFLLFFFSGFSNSFSISFL
jgi:hypothetical protein